MNEAAMSLDGKRVVVIGGTSGIGFAVAALAAQLGAEVVIASSRTANVDAALERLRGATGGTIDLRVRPAWRASSSTWAPSIISR